MKCNLLLIFLFFPLLLAAQDVTLQGTVKDENQNPISFVTVLLSQLNKDNGAEDVVATTGTTTDDLGNFTFETLTPGNYLVSFTYLGYDKISEEIEITAPYNLGTTYLKPTTQSLDEAVIVYNKPSIVKEPGKLTFNVENTAITSGNTMDILKQTPGVLVLQDNISIKNATPTVYINNKRVYLSSSEVASLLKSTDGSVIKSIEVITNPSAKYDAEASTVLNIITSKAVSIGYKGSINTTYEQGIFSKYSIGTSHFYKKDWVNIYAGYTINPRKEFKEDTNEIRFFDEAGATNGFRYSTFNRTTRSNDHQANLVADIKISEKHELGFSANFLLSPNVRYNNNALSQNVDRNNFLDSTFTTKSNLKIDTSNLAFNLNHTWKLGEAGANVVMNANYIAYDNERRQEVATHFFGPYENFIRENRFFTNALQESNIATAQLDVTIPALSGIIETGLKYSNIDTTSKLDFFSIDNGLNFEENLSDHFNYKEGIAAAYINYTRDWDRLSFNVGVSGEQTDITGTSRTLGTVNTQNYFRLFPKASVSYTLNDRNTLGASYGRSISRPRYESLNPFRYFINEFNFSDGNPNLLPAIDDKVTLSYTLDNKWFLEAYYWNTDNALSLIAFQDNDTRTLQNLNVNMINELQYSFDVVYASSLFSWWYAQFVTSTFYLENEFFALQSAQETETIDTFGFYGQTFNEFTISEKKGWTGILSGVYISNLLHGAATYKNQFTLSISLRKSFTKNRGSVTLGIDDIFNTTNIPVTTRYLNQDNSFFARAETQLLRLNLKYNFGNAILRDNNRKPTTNEGDRL